MLPSKKQSSQSTQARVNTAVRRGEAKVIKLHDKQSLDTVELRISVPRYLYDFMRHLKAPGTRKMNHHVKQEIASKMLERVLYKQHRYFMSNALLAKKSNQSTREEI